MYLDATTSGESNPLFIQLCDELRIAGVQEDATEEAVLRAFEQHPSLAALGQSLLSDRSFSAVELPGATALQNTVFEVLYRGELGGMDEDRNHAALLHKYILQDNLYLVRRLISRLDNKSLVSLLTTKTEAGVPMIALPFVLDRPLIARFLLDIIEQRCPEAYRNILRNSDNEGQSPLHLAIIHGSIRSLKVLLTDASQINKSKLHLLLNTENDQDYKPLELAIHKRQLPAVKAIIETMMNHLPKRLFVYLDCCRETSFEKPFIQSLCEGDVEMINCILETVEDADPAMIPKLLLFSNYEFKQPLFHRFVSISSANTVEMIQLLLDKAGSAAKEILLHQDKSGITPLEMAILREKSDAIKILFKTLWKDNPKSIQSNSKITDYLIDNSNRDELKLLLKSTKDNSWSNFDRLLFRSVKEDDIELLHLTLQKAKEDPSTNISRYPLLIDYVKSSAMAADILQHAGEKASQLILHKDYTGNTPLHRASNDPSLRDFFIQAISLLNEAERIELAEGSSCSSPLSCYWKQTTQPTTPEEIVLSLQELGMSPSVNEEFIAVAALFFEGTNEDKTLQLAERWWSEKMTPDRVNALQSFLQSKNDEGQTLIQHAIVKNHLPFLSWIEKKMPEGFIKEHPVDSKRPAWYDFDIDYLKGIYTDEPGKEYPRGFLYRIIGENDEHVGNIVGTVHIATKEMMQLNGKMREALEKSSNIYMELDISNIDKLQKLQECNSRIKLPELTEAQISKIKTYINSITPLIEKKFNLTLMNRNIPISVAYQAIKTVISSEALGRNSILGGIEAVLISFAKQNETPIYDLDTVELQSEQALRIYNNEHSDDYLSKLPTTQEEADSYIDSQIEVKRGLLTSWQKGDDEGARVGSEMPPSVLIPERERGMATNIDRALRSRKEGELPLFAVGCWHLVQNQNNILTQLRDKGWTIVRS